MQIHTIKRNLYILINWSDIHFEHHSILNFIINKDTRIYLIKNNIQSHLKRYWKNALIFEALSFRVYKVPLHNVCILISRIVELKTFVHSQYLSIKLHISFCFCGFLFMSVFLCLWFLGLSMVVFPCFIFILGGEGVNAITVLSYIWR